MRRCRDASHAPRGGFAPARQARRPSPPRSGSRRARCRATGARSCVRARGSLGSPTARSAVPAPLTFIGRLVANRPQNRPPSVRFVIFSGSYSGSIRRNGLARYRASSVHGAPGLAPFHASHGPMGEKALSTVGNPQIETLREIVLRYLNETGRTRLLPSRVPESRSRGRGPRRARLGSMVKSACAIHAHGARAFRPTVGCLPPRPRPWVSKHRWRFTEPHQRAAPTCCLTRLHERAASKSATGWVAEWSVARPESVSQGHRRSRRRHLLPPALVR